MWCSADLNHTHMTYEIARKLLQTDFAIWAFILLHWGFALYGAFVFIQILSRALRDTRNSIQAFRKSEEYRWWLWSLLPAEFLDNLWEQTKAKWCGYETHVI